MKGNVGKVFQDISIDSYPIYAVGDTGFIHLSNAGETVGSFIPYDSAFTGPEFFDNPVFIQCWVQL